MFTPVTRYDYVVDAPLSGTAIAALVKRCCLRAELDPAPFSGHSQRAGLITACAERNVPEHVIARTSRHVSVPVLRSYIRPATLFAEGQNAAAAVL